MTPGYAGHGGHAEGQHNERGGFRDGRGEDLEVSVGSNPTRATPEPPPRRPAGSVPWSSGDDASPTLRKWGFDSLRDDSALHPSGRSRTSSSVSSAPDARLTSAPATRSNKHEPLGADPPRFVPETALGALHVPFAPSPARTLAAEPPARGDGRAGSEAGRDSGDRDRNTRHDAHARRPSRSASSPSTAWTARFSPRRRTPRVATISRSASTDRWP